MTYMMITKKPGRRGRQSQIVPGVLNTTFQLTTTATSATYPFSMGLFFKKGDVPSGIQLNDVTAPADLVGYQVVPKRTWSDGSLKHCIVSGRVALVQNVAKTITVTNGTAPTGTNLTAADIVTAAPTATFIYDNPPLATVNLADLLASPIRTWVSGPEMVECHYYTPAGTSVHIAVWFHVRLFADGRMWVRVIVENGKLDNGAGAMFNGDNRTYIPTVSIGGVNVYTNGGVALSHWVHTRWSAEGWIGGNPAVTPKHNPAYMISTKLVPNYYWRTPLASTLNGLLQTYTPMSNGSISADQAGSGFAAHIGLMPQWDALYAATGDARAFRSMLANSSHENSYGIVWRDFTTHLPIKPSSFPSWTVLGIGGGGLVRWLAGSLQWDGAHHPSSGYLAYLCTGDYWHYETLALQTSFYWLMTTSARGSGVNRRVNINQTRGVAWGHRTYGQYAAVAPDGDAVAAEYRTCLANDYTYFKTRSEAVGASQIGYLTVMVVYGGGNRPMSIPAFEQHFMIQAIGHNWDIEPGFTSTVAHQAVRDYMYKAIVGILGGSGAANYCYTKAGIADQNTDPIDSPNLKVGDVAGNPPELDGFNPTQFYDTWGEVWTNTFFGAANTCSTGAIDFMGSNPGATGYIANLLPAIGVAVDHAATGAADSWARLSGASNWSSHVTGYSDVPIFGIPPRSYVGV